MIESPSPLRYLLGFAVMVVCVVLPVAYAFLKRRAPAAVARRT